MMQLTELLPIDPTDRERIVALNNVNVADLAWLDEALLDSLLDRAFLALKAGNDVEAFVIVLDQDAEYDSPNFNWFRERYPRFVYVDRIVTDDRARGKGHARRLYQRVFDAAREAGHDTVTCEVNFDPPNPVSDAFHTALEFEEVGRAAIHGGAKTVRYYARRVA